MISMFYFQIGGLETYIWVTYILLDHVAIFIIVKFLSIAEKILVLHISFVTKTA